MSPCPLCGCTEANGAVFCPNAKNNLLHVWDGLGLAMSGHQRQAVDMAVAKAATVAERRLLAQLIVVAAKTEGAGVWRALFAEILARLSDGNGL